MKQFLRALPTHQLIPSVFVWKSTTMTAMMFSLRLLCFARTVSCPSDCQQLDSFDSISVMASELNFIDSFDSISVMASELNFVTLK